MKKLSLLLCSIILLGGTATADEGMWLLPLINQLNAKGMKDAGLRLSPEDIYNINHSSIKDAIVIFGGGCGISDPCIPHGCFVKGDSRFAPIAAASVLAKTCRDEYMEGIHFRYPEYNWNINKGYPTPVHRKALAEFGPSPYHRKSFKWQ